MVFLSKNIKCTRWGTLNIYRNKKIVLVSTFLDVKAKLRYPHTSKLKRQQLESNPAAAFLA